MTKEATKEFKIGLVEFEELAKEFISIQANEGIELHISFEQMADWAIHTFKESIFSEELNQQKRKQEYFKLKEQLASMKQEFEPDAVEHEPIYVNRIQGDFYEAVADLQIGSCEGCAFENNADACGDACNTFNCLESEIIWIKAKTK